MQRRCQEDLSADHNRVVTGGLWLIVRKALPAKEKNATEAYDVLRRELRELP